VDFSTIQASAEKIFTVNSENPRNANSVNKVKIDSNEAFIRALIVDDKKFDVNSGIAVAIKDAVTHDPGIVVAKSDLDAIKANITAIESRKDFQISGNVYGGVEDLTDETAGIAVSVNANKILIDGGMIQASAAAEGFRAESSMYNLRARLNDRSAEMVNLWIELERYKDLEHLISSRVKVLDPLIKQLEKVTDAGVGDVSKVAAAERTISMIRVRQAEVSERLAHAQLNFINVFGALPSKVTFDSDFIANIVPDEISNEMVESVPALLADIALLKAAHADLDAVRAKDKLNLSFDARASRPFAGSDTDSDEQFGLILNKKLYRGGVKGAEILQATARVDAASGRISSTFSEGKRIIDLSYQSINAAAMAISLARDNAGATLDEIVYLRRQLVIGGSTLDQVLAAEARLYEAESQEINYLAELRKSQTLIISKLGLLAPAVGLSTD
jgi:outer membrane protein TolC